MVLAAIQAHMGHAEVQTKCYLALANLADNNPDNAAAISDAGGIPTVMAAMMAHVGEDVQEKGCAALENIGCSDLTKQKQIKKEGGVVVVQAAMTASGVTVVCKSS